MKKSAGCSKAEPIIFAPLQTPFPGARDGQNLISWRWSLPLPTNPIWRGSMHAISSYRGNSRTTAPARHRQGRLQYTAPQLSAQCKEHTTGTRTYLQGRSKQRGHFVLRLVTLEILTRSASNLAQIKNISSLTLNRKNLFESTLENKVAPIAPSSE